LNNDPEINVIGGDYPRDYAVVEEHLILPPQHIISPEELLRLQTQSAQSVTLQEALDAALLDVQRLNTERDVVSNRQADVERSLQETTLALEVQTQQNDNLVRLQVKLNERVQVLTTERDDVSRVVKETSALLQTQTQESVSLARELEISTSRARDLTSEKDNLQQSLTRAHLQLKQVPVLQEQLNLSDRKIKSLELNLAIQEQEKKKLLRDLDSKRHRDVEAAKIACKVEAEKQLEDKLNEFGEQVLHCLQSLRLSSEELTGEFSRACSEAYAEGCCLTDFFEIIQKLIDHMKVTSNSLQVNLNDALQQLVQNDTQVKSLCLKATELEKVVAEKTQRYETTVNQLRTAIGKNSEEKQILTSQLTQKQEEYSLLTNQFTQSKQEFAAALDEWNKNTKSLQKQISMKDLTISQLRANVQQHEQSLRGVNTDLHQKLTVIESLKKRAGILEANCTSKIDETKKLELEKKNLEASFQELEIKFSSVEVSI
jgi:chromosome segregation ATPase